MTDAKAIEYAEALVDFCKKQKGCQNCVFRLCHGDHWDCYIDEGLMAFVYGADEVRSNLEAKRKNHGYI